MTVNSSIRPFLLMSVCLATACGAFDDDVQTVQWQLDGNGYVQFLTNDPLWYGYSYWRTYTQSFEPTMTTVTAAVKKQAGSYYTGFGIVFCYQDDDNYYLLLIDAASHYTVLARAEGAWRKILPWSLSPTMNLKSGLGVENVVSVTQDSPSHFSISFNGSFNGSVETSFVDSAFSGGTAGFYVSIGAKEAENFPQTREDVRLRMIAPASYP